MGRTFDAIRLAEATRPREADRPGEPDEPAVVAAPEAVLPDLPTDAPYIEVGRKEMTASADVLAAPGPRPAVVAGPRLHLRAASLPVATTGTLPAEVVAFHDPGHPLAAQYRALTTALLDLRPGLGPRTFGFTTALAGMSAGAVLLNVGVAAARLAARRVVLVEADLRQPTLAATLSLSASPGLVEVLAGVVPVEQAVRTTMQANLLVVPAGETEPESLALLRVEPLRQVLRRLALRADLLLVALPRWDARPDVLAASACCEALFVIAPEAEADQPHVRDVLAQVPAHGAPLAGTVLLAA